VCDVCGENGHGEASCPNPPRYVNCNGSHASSDRSCPVYLTENLSKNSASRTVSLSLKEGKRSWDLGQEPGIHPMPWLFAAREESMLHPRLQTPQPPGNQYTSEPSPALLPPLRLRSLIRLKTILIPLCLMYRDARLDYQRRKWKHELRPTHIPHALSN
jgi:hypothetical protein